MTPTTCSAVRSAHWRTAVALGVAILISACSSGDRSDREFATDNPVPTNTSEKAVTASSYVFDNAPNNPDFALRIREAVRFLNQASFGATRELAREVRRIGRDAWLTQQMTMPIEATHVDRLNAYTGPTFPAPGQLFGIMDGQEIMVNLTWQSWVESPDQLRKRIAAALLEIFVITARVDVVGIKNNQHTAASFLDLLERHAFGNYRDLLYDVSRHPAMGHYLSFVNNEKARYGADGNETRVPDENYAREILQLFSIGLYRLNQDGTLKRNAKGKPIETYTQDDIFNLARVFTGWERDGSQGNYESFARPMIANAVTHSPEAKNFLGISIAAGTNAEQSLNRAIQRIANHPNTAPFISKQLIQRLVTSNPTAAYVERVSTVFADDSTGTRGNLGAVVRAILLDPEARAIRMVGEHNVIRGKLREPMMRLTSIARLLGDRPSTVHYPIANLMSTSHGLGQAPFKSPSVFNFFRPGYTPPASQIADLGYVAPEFQIVAGSAIPASINLINEYIDRGGDSLMIRNWEPLMRFADDAPRLIRRIDLLLNGRALNRRAIAQMAAVVDAIPFSRPLDRVKAALQLVSSSPEFLILR